MAVFFIMEVDPTLIKLKTQGLRLQCREIIKSDGINERVSLAKIEQPIAEIALFEAGIDSSEVAPKDLDSDYAVFCRDLGVYEPRVLMPKYHVLNFRGCNVINSVGESFDLFVVSKGRSGQQTKKFGIISSGLSMHGPINFWKYDPEEKIYRTLSHDIASDRENIDFIYKATTKAREQDPLREFSYL